MDPQAKDHGTTGLADEIYADRITQWHFDYNYYHFRNKEASNNTLRCKDNNYNNSNNIVSININSGYEAKS